MGPETLLRKTELGQSEIAKPAMLHSRPLRNVLIFVDGNRDVRTLQDMMRSIAAPPDALEQLLRLGFIAPAATTTEPPSEPRADDAFLHDDTELPPELDIDTRTVPDESSIATEFSSLYKQINTLVSGNLGMIKAYGMQLKIEQCQTSDQLLALLPEIKAALVARHGEAKAIALLRKLSA